MSLAHIRTNRTGQAENYFQLSWTNPADVRYGGVTVLGGVAGSGVYLPYGHVPAPGTSIEISLAAPNTSQNWDFYLVPYDVNNQQDSIVPGVTPTIAVTMGTTGGTFDSSNLLGTASVGSGNNFVAQYVMSGATKIGFLGSDSVSGYVGAWFNQCKIGGSGPANAPFYTDASGNVFLNGTLGGGSVSITGGTFTLTDGGVTTTINSGGFEVTNGSASFQVTSTQVQFTGSNGNVEIAATGVLSVSQTGPLNTTTISGGTMTVDTELTVGNVSVWYGPYSSATAGTASLPASPAGFIGIEVSGTLYKIPYYAA